MRGRVDADGRTFALESGPSIALPSPMPQMTNRDVLMGVRPEHLEIRSDGGLAVTVRMVEQLGHETLLICDAAGTRVVVRQGAEAEVPAVGAEIRLDATEAHRHRFDPLTERRIDP
jgi:ABC-type sugar transport system ATPase subunit